jgi:nicotinate-nucleotide pyrophosphorylase (carboxylating)
MRMSRACQTDATHGECSSRWSPGTEALIRAALDEDLGPMGRDTTSALLPDGQRHAVGRLVSREAGVACGLALATPITNALAARGAARIELAPPDSAPVRDGSAIRPGQVIGLVRGPKSSVLIAERTLLNFIARLSGVATLTRRFVDAVRAAGSQAQIFDTRKTLPGWRELDRYAVRCGGGCNHRFGLFDAVLIKGNHLTGVATAKLPDVLAGMLQRLPTVPQQRAGAPDPAAGRSPVFVEVEVDDLEQFRAVFQVHGIHAVLLDNFDAAQLREAVALRDAAGLHGKLLLEASGGVTLERVGAVAATGVDRIAVGALTHGAPWLDVGLDF